MLPLEILERIGSFADRNTARKLSLCSSNMYAIMQNRLWNNPRIIISSNYSEIMKIISKFPIKILGPEIGVVNVQMLKTFRKLKAYHPPKKSLTSQEIANYLESGLILHLNSLSIYKPVKPWLMEPGNMRKELKESADIMRKFLCTLTFNHHHDYRLWDVQNLGMFFGISIPLLSLKCICFHKEHIVTLPDILSKLDIKQIKMKVPGCGFAAEISEAQFMKYQQLPITHLSTVFLKEKLFPWGLMKDMSHLRFLYLRDEDLICLTKMEELKIQGLCMGKCQDEHKNNWEAEWKVLLYYDILIVDVFDISPSRYICTENITIHL